MTFSLNGTNKANGTVTHNPDGSIFIYALPIGISLPAEDAVKLAHYILDGQPADPGHVNPPAAE